MDIIRQYSNKPWVVFLVALVVGLIIGIFILGYWLWPVDWYDSAVSQLRSDLKEEWLRLAIDSFAANPDANLAVARYQQLEADAPSLLATVQANPGAQDMTQVQAFAAIVQAQASPPAAAQPEGEGFPTGLLIALIILAILLFIGVVAFLVMRLRSRAYAGEQPTAVGELFLAQEETLEETPAEEETEAVSVAQTAEAELPEMQAEETPPAIGQEPGEAVEQGVEQTGEAAVESEITPAAEFGFEPLEEASALSPEQELSKFYYDLAYIEGIGPVYAEKLKAEGIDTPRALLERCASAKGRLEVATATGISEKLILRWVNHVDLFRIKGVGAEYAHLLEAAGVDTIKELAARNPSNLYQRLVSINMDKRLVRKLPFPSQVANWIEQAQQLPQVVTY